VFIPEEDTVFFGTEQVIQPRDASGLSRENNVLAFSIREGGWYAITAPLMISGTGALNGIWGNYPTIYNAFGELACSCGKSGDFERNMVFAWEEQGNFAQKSTLAANGFDMVVFGARLMLNDTKVDTSEYRIQSLNIIIDAINGPTTGTVVVYPSGKVSSMAFGGTASGGYLNQADECVYDVQAKWSELSYCGKIRGKLRFPISHVDDYFNATITFGSTVTRKTTTPTQFTNRLVLAGLELEVSENGPRKWL
jgi:hypothetical protein